MDSDLVYVSVANAALASVPYLIALDHTTRWEPGLPLQAALRHLQMMWEQPASRVHAPDEQVS